MKYYVYYKLADIVIKVGFDFEYLPEKSYMNQFVIEETEDIDYYFEFCKTNSINAFLKKTPIKKDESQLFHYYQNENGEEQCFHLIKDMYYHAVTIIGEREGYCHYISYSWLKEAVDNGYYLENFFCLEKILMQFQCMILHSCHIQHGGKSILFSAPSGTGKSTQGELWEKYAGAEVINGDRTAIRKVNNEWKAYGVPFCGTSGIHENKQAPLQGIVVLRQNSENQVCILSGRNAFNVVYSEVTVNNWNIEFVNKAVEWVSELIAEIPVYGFMCTKEKEAVEVLMEYIERGNE